MLNWVPTADQINSIKPDQAVEYWSGSVGMSGRGWSDLVAIELSSTWYHGNMIGWYINATQKEVLPVIIDR
ncbi:hypothetical protein DPMN_057639 [Dreissena polymorpha]|uniref:Uncharacterized protein n=1 Tax=Dreissena polymorpha TaxID=45954 RepID=A0A9D4HF51_DREPO|nr:hypothetical protein DPMN_057639 [Dreissena polymorpha]